MANPVDPALIAALRDAVGPAITSIAVILLFGGPLAIMLIKDRRKKTHDSLWFSAHDWTDVKNRLDAVERELEIQRRLREGDRRDDLPRDR